MAYVYPLRLSVPHCILKVFSCVAACTLVLLSPKHLLNSALCIDQVALGSMLFKQTVTSPALLAKAIFLISFFPFCNCTGQLLLDLGGTAGSVFITIWGTLGATEVVALVVFVIVLPAVVTALVLGVLGVFAVVAFATVVFCLGVVIGVVTDVVNGWTLFFSLLYLAFSLL